MARIHHTEKNTSNQSKADPKPKNASISDLEKRLDYRLGLVDGAGGWNSDLAGERKGQSKNPPPSDVPRTYEISEALDLGAMGLDVTQQQAAEMSGDIANGDSNNRRSHVNHPPSSDAMNWSGIDPNGKTKTVAADIHKNNGRAGLLKNQPIEQPQDAATAALTLLAATQKSPEISDKLPDTLDSMEFGAEKRPANATKFNTVDDAKLLALGAAINSANAGATRQDDIAEPFSNSTDLVPVADPDGSTGLVVPLDMDSNAPRLASHVKREETAPDGSRSLVITGFLGGLSIAFIAIWGYIYTLPRDQAGTISSEQNGLQGAPANAAKLTLKVENFSARAHTPVPMRIYIEGDEQERGILVKLEGLPADARLSHGFPSGNGEWIVPAAQLRTLTLSLIEMPNHAIIVHTRLLEKDAETHTGNFASFQINPESSSRAIKGREQRIYAAAPNMPTIPKPEPAGLKNNGSSAIIEAEDDIIGELPQDIANPSYNSNSAQQMASRAASPKPPARARSARGRPAGDMSDGRVALPEADQRQTTGGEPKLHSKKISDAHRGFIREGNKFMRRGKIKKARALYNRAKEGGAPEAALALGRSYDPNYIARIKNADEVADSARALELYREALSGGLAAAQIKIDRLLKSISKD